MNRKMIVEVIYIRVSDRKQNPIATQCRNVPTQSWSGKSAVFPYGERSDVPRLQQVEQKAVGQQRNLELVISYVFFLVVNLSYSILTYVFLHCMITKFM